MRMLNSSEVEIVSGGGAGSIIRKGLELIGAIDAAKDFIDGFKEGFGNGYDREKNR